MPLNPHVEALLQFMADQPQIDFDLASPGEVRAAYDQSVMLGEPPKVAMVTDVKLTLEGRTLDGRLYIPEGAGRKTASDFILSRWWLGDWHTRHA